MKRILLLSIFLITCLSVATTCIFFGIEDTATVFIVPIIVSILGVIATSYLLVVETVIGHKEYHYSDDVLSIKRKGKTVFEIQKGEVTNLTLIYDVDTDNLYLISFEYCNKKHYIAINSNNKDVLKFVDGIDHNKKNNYWYYLIYIMEILLV